MRAKSCACDVASASLFPLSICPGSYTCAWACCVCYACQDFGAGRGGRQAWMSGNVCAAPVETLRGAACREKAAHACHVTAYVMCDSACDAWSMRLFTTIQHVQLLVGTWPSFCCGHASVCRREARCANVHERVTRGVTPWKRLQGPSIAAPRRRVKGACRRRVCNASFAQLHV